MHARRLVWSNEGQDLVAVIITALIFGVPTTFGQEECPQGASFIVSFDSVLPLADVVQNVLDPQSHFLQECLEVY